MIPHESEKTKCITNMEGGSNFTIKASSKMFRVLSSGLYSNKVKAVIREVSCNAVDANVDAGNKDKPILIHLPNEIEPFFSCKDQGTGLTPKQMTEIYTSYGTSTKTDRNDQIGALGLGSKSPFSLVDSFTITSIVSGKKYVYSAYLNGEGEPKLQSFGEGVPTDEENGIEVSFPVNSKDFNSFREESELIFRPFEVKPEIVGNSNCKIKSFNVLLKGDDWELVQSENTYSWRQDRIRVAVQGNIEYPINLSLIESKISKDARHILSENFRLHFNIGELDIAASREELGYDETTINNIVSKLEKMVSEVEEKISFKINKFNSKYEAMRYLVDLTKETNFYNHINVTYKGDILTTSIDINENNIVEYSLNARRNIHRNALVFTFRADETKSKVCFVFNDNNKNTQAVTKARSLVGEYDIVYLVQELDFLKKLGIEDYKKASELSLPNKNKTEPKQFKKAILRQYWGREYFSSEYNTPKNLGLDTSKDFFFVPIKGKNMVEEEDIYSLKNLGINLGIIKETDIVYGVSQALCNSKKFLDFKGINFVEFMKTEINKNETVKKHIVDFQKREALITFRHNLDSNFYKLIKDKNFIEKLGAHSDFKRIHKEWLELKTSSKNENETVDFLIPLKHLIVNSKSANITLDTTWAKKYPLIADLGYGFNTANVIDYVNLVDTVKENSSN